MGYYQISIFSPTNFYYGIISVPEDETFNFIKDQVEKLTSISSKSQILYTQSGIKLETSNYAKLLQENSTLVVHTGLSLKIMGEIK